VRGIQVGIAVAALVVVLRMTPWTQRMFPFPLIESYAYDVAHDWAKPEPPEDIIIVAIDEKSLSELGRFQSWHRDIYARLLEGPLRKAAVVGFDVLVPEADEEIVAGDPEGRTADDVFADAIRRHGRVALAAHWVLSGANAPPDDGSSERFAYGKARGRLERATGCVLELPTRTLADAAAAVGYVDMEADSDGVYRRFRPMMIGQKGLVFPHFGMAVMQLATDAKGETLVADVARGQYRVPGRAGAPMAIDRGGATLISYCGPTGTVARVSLVDALRDKGVAEQLAGKIVLVGATAQGLSDVRPAPYAERSRLFFGVETNASIVDSLLRRAPLVDAGESLLWGGFGLVIGVLVSLTVWLMSAETVAVALSLALVGVVCIPSFLFAFRSMGLWIPYGAILLAGVLPLGLGLYERLTVERRLIKRQFDAYVSPEVLQELMDEPDVIRRSQRRVISLLFADVRGSTTLSESIPPEVWVAQLNEYLTQMSLAIFAFEGYLDKFMGDGIMAAWNAFGNQEDDHAELAVKAGRQMLARLDFLNKKWEQMPDRTPFRIGIGVHTGQVVMGSVGSEERVEFTAIGDVVNTASRIEGLTKELGCEFIISETTAALLGGGVPLRTLGEAEIRGREAKIEILEVPGRSDALEAASGAVLAEEARETED